jgi:hypothetical protein
MKRIIISGCIILVLVSVAFVSNAKMEKIAITEANLPDIKGKWVGTRTIGMETLNTDLEILNDTLPVQSKFTFYDVRRPGQSAGATVVNEFKNGKINDQGNLLIVGPNAEIELSLYKDGGKMKLEGKFFLAGPQGTMSFKKK